MNLPCTSCGQCCRMVGQMLIFKKALSPGDRLYKEVTEFPYEAIKGGSCEKLSPEGLCTVYSERPELCRSEVIRERYFRDQPEVEFYTASARHCNSIMDNAGVPEDLRIKIPLITQGH